MILNSESVWYQNSCLYGIKRKEIYLQKYILENRKNYVVLNEEILISDLKQLAKAIFVINPENLVIVNSKDELNNIFEVFTSILNAKLITGKFKPGTFTNPLLTQFSEPHAIFVIHDRREHQAISEAKKLRIKVLGITNLSRGVNKFDFCAIMNNFAEISLCYGLYFLLQEVKRLENSSLMSFEEYKNLSIIEKNDQNLPK